MSEYCNVSLKNYIIQLDDGAKKISPLSTETPMAYSILFQHQNNYTHGKKVNYFD